MTKFVGVGDIKSIVESVGLESFITTLAEQIRRDFVRWSDFEKAPRLASHSPNGVIELMPTSDASHFGFKYVNGHPTNRASGLQTVAAFGVLSDVKTGYPVMICEMTILTALRTAVTSALAAQHLARANARCMAIIGLGAQSEFQAFAFKALLGIERLRVWDMDPLATEKFTRNLSGRGYSIYRAQSTQDAVLGADIVTTITADKVKAHILSDNMIGSGVHLNAVGGDCPGKTELSEDILKRASVFVEFSEQTRIEGEIQQMPSDFPVTELWRVIAGEHPGRKSDREITIFDSVGFAIEDFSTLCFLNELTKNQGFQREIDLIPNPQDPRDLFGILG